MTIKAAREIKNELEQAGEENIRILVTKGVSVVGTFLQACPPKEQAEYRRNFNFLIARGVTPEMVLDELSRQMPKIASIMNAKKGYRDNELEKISEFLKGA